MGVDELLIKQINFNINNNSIELRDNIEEVDLSICCNPLFYDTDSFHQYHKKYAQEVFKVIFQKDSKVVGWCYIGSKNHILSAPYSSSFSLIYPKRKWRYEDLLCMSNALIEIARYLKLEQINITLPSDIYYPNLINAEIVALLNAGFKIEYIDINHYFSLDGWESKQEFLSKQGSSYKKQYNQALRNNLEFICLPKDEWQKAYSIIQINRLEKGYPLKITLEHMQDIIDLESANVNCFVVNYHGECIAAAIVFDVSDDISQVVYWGDVLEHRDKRAMSFLSINLLEHYKQLGKKILDIGTSSEKGKINLGLAEFKKSIGCQNSTKVTLTYNVKY